MKTLRTPVKEFLSIRLNPGDDLYDGIVKAVKDEGVKNAVILQGVGSVTSHSYHVVSSPVIPPKNEFIKGDRPADIVNINGYVINGKVHAHVIYGDANVCYGGHLEPGAQVLTFAAVTLAEVDEEFTYWDKRGVIEDHIKTGGPV